MKPVSKITILILLSFGLAGGAFAAAAAGNPFAVVPAGDPTYAELRQLETAGLLPAGASQGPLTRFEVAERVFSAQRNYKEIVVAQADSDIPPPPDDNSAAASSPDTGTTGNSTAETAAPSAETSNTPGFKPETDADLAQAEQNLHSLQDAYQYELKVYKDGVKGVQDREAGLEAAQYDLWKRLKGITEYPTITVHGLGRAFGISQQYYGDSTAFTTTSAASRRYATGFLDFNAEAVVSKEIRFDSVIRYGTSMTSNMTFDSLFARRASINFNPPWFSATLGDFYEAYTPLTLWNRNDLDLRYMPEMYQRHDDESKYETYLNNEPYWPFRGIHVGTDIGWKDSDVLQEFKVSAMAHMIRNGFNDTATGGTYYGSQLFTDWILGGNGELKSKRWFLGGNVSVQLGLDAYGVILTEPLNTDLPGSPYRPFDPSTWAHHYQVGSLKPSFDVGLGDDVSFGGTWEGAFAVYQDDEMDANKTISDYAILAGPYFRFGHSKITFNYLNVGPNYFSPLAQTRQDALTVDAGYSIQTINGPGFWTAPLHTQFILSNVPRAGSIFGYYDRTQDNTFPYGLSTPNRQGIGFDVDVKTLEKNALKIPASVYFVQEISSNMVVNSGGTGYIAVDGTASAANPLRNFTYVNVGPSFNLGPYIGTGDLEIGANVRYEQTSSSIGTLNSTWILGGIRTQVFSWWEVAASFGVNQASGSEAGLGGFPLARYSYLFDNSDLGKYQVFNVNGSDNSWRLSTTFKVNRNSSIYADYDLTWGNLIPFYGTPAGSSGTLHNQYIGLTYEIEF